jgi:hypothetical protein
MDLTPLQQTNKQQQKIRIASASLPVFSSMVRLIRGVGVGGGNRAAAAAEDFSRIESCCKWQGVFIQGL